MEIEGKLYMLYAEMNYENEMFEWTFESFRNFHDPRAFFFTELRVKQYSLQQTFYKAF